MAKRCTRCERFYEGGVCLSCYPQEAGKEIAKNKPSEALVRELRKKQWIDPAPNVAKPSPAITTRPERQSKSTEVLADVGVASAVPVAGSSGFDRKAYQRQYMRDYMKRYRLKKGK